MTLPALAASYFTLGVGSLSIVGLVEPMATDLDASRATIVLMVTAFALTYAIAAPALQMLVGHLDHRRLVLVGLSGIAIGAVASAAAPTIEILAASRMLMAAGAALAGPMASARAAVLVPPPNQGAALGVVFGGMTLATVLGVPLSAFLGQLFGWRVVMLFVAGLALATMLLVRTRVPGDSHGQRTTPAALWGVLTDRVLAPALSVTLFQMAAQFATYALIGAYLTRAFGLDAAFVPAVLLTYGVGGIAGNAIATRLIGRLGPARMIPASLVVLTLLFAAFPLLPPSAPAALALVAAWAVAGMAMMAPQQARLVSLAGDKRNLLLALNASALYLGMAGGSALAGAVDGAYGVAALPVVSAILALAALGGYFASRR
jgi:DHA1 family inner membrane transport protein